MRAVALALMLVMAGGAALAVEKPSVQQLLRAVREAHGACYSADEATKPVVCEWRDRLVGRLFQAGYCYGKRGQVEGDKQWHRCGAGSIVVNDLRAPDL